MPVFYVTYCELVSISKLIKNKKKSSKISVNTVLSTVINNSSTFYSFKKVIFSHEHGFQQCLFLHANVHLYTSKCYIKCKLSYVNAIYYNMTRYVIIFSKTEVYLITRLNNIHVHKLDNGLNL